MSETTYKTWDNVPEDVQLKALHEGLRKMETDQELAEFLARKLNIPIELIPKGECIRK